MLHLKRECSWAFHSGSSLTDAAKAAGVTRQTLHRWRTQYHWFSEAMEVWEEGQMIIARSRLVDMADNAIDTLANVIADGNARAAMMVLRSLRILRTYAPLKPPVEKIPSVEALRGQWDGATAEPRQAGIALARGQGKEAGDTGWKRVVREQEKEAIAKQASGATATPPLPSPAAASEQAGYGAASAGKVAPEERAPGKTRPPAAQQINVTSNPPAQRPKTAILAENARSAIENACYSALQEVTGSYEMLHANHA